MPEPVRLRGEVGERRKQNVLRRYGSDRRGWGYVTDRRQSPSIAARVEECIAAAREPLLRLIEEQAAEIERLRESKGVSDGIETTQTEDSSECACCLEARRFCEAETPREVGAHGNGALTQAEVDAVRRTTKARLLRTTSKLHRELRSLRAEVRLLTALVRDGAELVSGADSGGVACE